MASISGNLGSPSASRARETTLPTTKTSGARCQLVGAESFDSSMPKRAQLVAHRRVDARVAARDPVSGFAGQCGKATHEGAADARGYEYASPDSRDAACSGRPDGSRKRLRGQNAADGHVQQEIAATAARLGGRGRAGVRPRQAPRAARPGAARAHARCRTTTRSRPRCANTSSCSAATRSRANCTRCACWRSNGWSAWRDFRPYVGGAVWHGTATRLSDIYIQLFCDDSKSAEIALIDHHVDYEPRMVTGFHGEQVEALSVHAMSRLLGEEIGVHLLVYDLDDLRGALKPDAQGRTPRGNLAALRRLVEEAKPCADLKHRWSTARAVRSPSAARRLAVGGVRWRGCGRCGAAPLARQADGRKRSSADGFWAARFDRPDGGELRSRLARASRC